MSTPELSRRHSVRKMPDTNMYWLAFFTDEPKKRHLRPQLLAAHFEYLRAHGDTIQLAGAIRSDDASPWMGAVWIIATESKADAVQLCEEDPFFAQGLRSGYQLFQWGRAPHFGAPGAVSL